MTSPIDHGLALFLILIFPFWDRWETKHLKANSTAATRIRSYQKTIAWLWLATLLLLATTPIATLFHPPPSASLPIEWSRFFTIAVALGLLGGLALSVIMARRSPGVRAEHAKRLEPLRFFLPESRSEKIWFAGVCLSAGICEEFIFRGFLIRYLLDLPLGLTIVPSVLLAAVIFGIDHAYQGWVGVVQTTILALIFTFLFIGASALWLPMVVHALLDLRILLVLDGGMQPETSVAQMR